MTINFRFYHSLLFTFLTAKLFAQCDTCATIKVDLGAAAFGNLSVAIEQPFSKYGSYEVGLRVFTPSYFTFGNAKEISGFVLRVGQIRHVKPGKNTRITNRKINFRKYVRYDVLLMRRHVTVPFASHNPFEYNVSNQNNMKDYIFNQYAIGFIGNLGGKWSLTEILTLDAFVGYGFSILTERSNFEFYGSSEYKDIKTTNWIGVFSANNSPISLQLGLRLGYQLKR